MLLIYMPAPSPRSEYVFDWIFRQQWGIDYTFCNILQEASNASGPLINYSHEKIRAAFHIQPAGLLEDDTLRIWDPQVTPGNDFPMLFPNKSDIGFDIFSAIFYSLSRYEEYLPFSPDVHGRFPAAASLAYQFDFLKIPVVDHWLMYLKAILAKKLPELYFPSNSFSSAITYDIDAAFQYRGKGVLRTVAGWVRDAVKLNFHAVMNRGRSIFSKEADPWNVFPHLKNVLDKSKAPSIFFYLVGDRSPMDANLHYENPDFKNVIAFTAAFSTTGLHPSYKCMQQAALLIMEKKRLEKVLGREVEISRQHFLRFTLPDTYQALASAGITADYSMFYAEAPGFRAGTSRPFHFYDLKNEVPTPLMVYPGTCMDYTFYKYLKMKPEQALQEMKILLNEVKKCGGNFIPVFHNEILGMPEWRNIHDQLLEELSLPPYNEIDN